MKILFVCTQLPLPLNVGSKIRIYNLLKSYSEKHELTLISFIQNKEEYEHISKLNKICKKVYGIPFETCYRFNQSKYKLLRIISKLFSPTPFLVKSFTSPVMINKIIDEMNKINYDIMHVQRLMMVPNILSILNKKNNNLHNLLDLDDIESKKMMHLAKIAPSYSVEKFLNYLDFFKLLYYEKKVLKLFDNCLVCSEKDKRQLSEKGIISKIEVIPNGVDLQDNECEYETNMLNDKIILFLGAMNYKPNEDAVLYFVKYIFPLIKRKIKTVQFIIAGKSPSARIQNMHNGQDILVTGYIDDVKKLFRKCTIFVVPIRAGGGTRIKILEAMSMGKPVVSTSIGCEGIEVINGENIMIADSPADFAMRCIDLLVNEVKRKYISFNARNLVIEKYNWRSIGKKLNDILQMGLRESFWM